MKVKVMKMNGLKLTKICDASFFAALGLVLDNEAGIFINSEAIAIAQFLNMHYHDITSFPLDQLPGNPEFPEGAALNAGLMAAAYADAITKTFNALHLVYDAISLIDLQKSIAFDATDSTDRVLTSTNDTVSNSSTTYDSQNPVLTGRTESNYTRNDNADTTMDHDTSEHTTGTDGRRSPQELIQAEIDFRARNVFMDYLCSLCKDMFGSGVYEEDD